eukprot:15453459-Alexandrium_andersonii.AAC.1
MALRGLNLVVPALHRKGALCLPQKLTSDSVQDYDARRGPKTLGEPRTGFRTNQLFRRHSHRTGFRISHFAGPVQGRADWAILERLGLSQSRFQKQPASDHQRPKCPVL